MFNRGSQQQGRASRVLFRVITRVARLGLPYSCLRCLTDRGDRARLPCWLTCHLTGSSELLTRVCFRDAAGEIGIIAGSNIDIDSQACLESWSRICVLSDEVKVEQSSRQEHRSRSTSPFMAILLVIISSMCTSVS